MYLVMDAWTGTSITLNAEVADDVLKKAVEDQDYKVTGIQ